MNKITYIISDVDKAVAFEWMAQGLNKNRYELSFILLNPGPSYLENYLKSAGVPVQRIICRGKKDWPQAIIQTARLLRQINPTVVHCHLLQANIIGLMAAKLARVPKRIYTRHHSSLHHMYFKKGVWWDKLSNALATHIIAISGAVKHILVDWEKVSPEKVILVPHGFKLNDFQNVGQDRIHTFTEKYQLQDRSPVIGVISRFTAWKGVQHIIPAFQELLQEYPTAVLLLLNAKGDYERELLALLKGLPETSYRRIPFENDIAAAYKCMDLFVHVPIDGHSEAFGQTYVEALAAGVPSIFTQSGIASDFVVHEQNALVVPFKDAEAILLQMKLILQKGKEIEAISKRGITDVERRFSLDKMIYSLEALYTA